MDQVTEVSIISLHHLFKDAICSLGVEQVIEKPTRKDGDLDLMLTSNPNMIPYYQRKLDPWLHQKKPQSQE